MDESTDSRKAQSTTFATIRWRLSLKRNTSGRITKEDDSGSFRKRSTLPGSQIGEHNTIEAASRDMTTVAHTKTIVSIIEVGPPTILEKWALGPEKVPLQDKSETGTMEDKAHSGPAKDANCIGKSGGLMLMWKKDLVVSILSYSTVKLVDWSNSRFKNLSKQIEEKNREIERLYKSCEVVGDMDSIKKQENSMDGLLECEDLYWKQRSKVDWLEAGDRNTNVIYKTVTKVIDSRLKTYLQNIISSNQSAFVPGRQIFDNVLIAFETLHSISLKKTGKKGMLALKLDMSKAYDRVEWNFLQAVKTKMNFPPRWSTLIMDYISTANLSFHLNGIPVCDVIPFRGLRQGCPLFSIPFFLLCSEAFSCLISDSERNGRGLGIRSSRGGPLISHLFFADNSILFSRVSKDCSLKILRILEVYERGSGHQINLQKSKLTFSLNVLASHMSETQSLLGVNVYNCQDKYLGLPSMVGRNKRLLFNDIKDRVWKKFRGWNDSMFSFGGKEVLIKAVAQAVPTYAMSIYKIPVGLYLYLFNQSLLAKQAWRILERPDSLAAKVLKAKYFKNDNFQDATIKKGCSHIWRSLLWGRSYFSKGIRWVVRDGNNIRVFKDQWIHGPNTFKPITVDPGIDLRVADLLDRNHRGWSTTKLNCVMLPIENDIIMSIPISWRGGKDSIAWHFDNKGVYTVQSGYRLVLDLRVGASSSNSSISLGWWNSLWRLNIPPKVHFFLEGLLECYPFRGEYLEKENGGLPSLQQGALPVIEVFQYANSHPRTDDLDLICMIAWAIWDNRNCLLDSDSSKSLEQVLLGADAFLQEFQSSIRVFSSRTLFLSPKLTPTWIHPPPGRFKLNMAVAVNKFSNIRGIGVAIRNDKVAFPLVVSILNDPSAHGVGSKFLVKDILAMLVVVGGNLGQVIFKSGNTLAHKLALLAFSSARERLWLASSPLCSSPTV
ncbi:hypothetical protein Dsin_015993 [Dipteronia sinensis]|uniref:Reverse transcriptase domain-containing protein n=1 Tax=Dipteronia sinensis TaxID=43782 RepID=A0AAE0ADG5_9ROSI|nr:hypothetical protein Dsin_015993 [Dipteronia sinensis]